MRKLAVSLVAAVCLVMVMVMPVFAAPADIEGFYMAKAPTHVYDTDNVQYDFDFPYLGVWLEQTDEVVTGYLFGFNASSVSGCKVKSGTSTYNATTTGSKNLGFAGTNITVTVAGTLGVYVKTGCYATATNGTGTVEGAPVTCTAGWNTLNVTGNGTIAFYTWMDYTLLAEVAGTVGSSRLALIGPDLTTLFEDGNATITGVTGVLPDDQAELVAPGWKFAVTGNGTASITLPTGTSGLAAGTNLTVNGAANYTLDETRETSLALVTTGTNARLTITLETDRAFEFSGRVITNWWSGTMRLRGGFQGFLILSNDPWNAELLDFTFSGSELGYDPLMG